MNAILNYHLAAAEDAASPRDIQRALNPTVKEVAYMGDHRYKGYPGEFMFSPRAPITEKPSSQRATSPEQSRSLQQQREPMKNRSHHESPNQTEAPHRQIHSEPINPNQTYQELRETHEKMMAEKRSAELRRYQAQREIADKDIAFFKEEQLRERLSQEVEKKRDLELQRSYNPWGKPGHGAPINAEIHKKQKFTEHDLFGPYGEENPKLRQSGLSELENHRMIGEDQQQQEKSIQEAQDRIDSIRKDIANLRPNPTKDMMTGGSRYSDKKASFEFYDPWGKGMGNPRRRQDGYTERFPQIKEMGIVPSAEKSSDSWPGTATYRGDERHSEPLIHRLPKLPPHPSKLLISSSMPDDQMKAMLHTHLVLQQPVDNPSGTGLSMDNPYGGGGEAVKTHSGNNRTRVPITLRRDIYGNAMKEIEGGYNPFKSTQGASTNGYNPFGKPGAGAPNRDQNGRVVPMRRNIDFAHELDSSADINKRRKAADEYLHELKKEMSAQRRHREEANIEYKAPIGELAAVVQQGKVGNPKRDPVTGQLTNQHLGTSDVTKHKMGQVDKRRDVLGEQEFHVHVQQSRDYHSDLTRLAEERHRMRKLEKVRDNQEDRQHNQSWNDLWGRPGGGAPIPGRKNKHKFSENLHHSEAKQGNLYDKNTPHGISQMQPASYHNKTTIPSNHQNMFELQQDRQQRLQQTGYYPVAAPFATL